MIIRTIVILILATAVYATDFIDNWEPGKVEKLFYEIRTYKPAETVNNLELEIERSKDKEPTFIVKQVLTIPGQSLVMHSKEIYTGEDLKIVSSENFHKLPIKAMKHLKVDTLVTKGQADKGKFKITFNSIELPESEIPLTEHLTTTVGFRLVSRNMNFKIGSTFEYDFINLLSLTDTISKAPDAKDTVIGIERIRTPAGNFECYKVKNLVTGSESYNYYTTDAKHIPVKTEIIDPLSGKPAMTIILQKYE